MNMAKHDAKSGNSKPLSPIIYLWDLLITFWLIVVMVQYIARYYILIPDVDYSIAYIVMACAAAGCGVVRLAAYIISGKRNHNK